MLTFVGLGLGKDGITLEGLKEAEKADAVYAEFYTSLIPGLELEDLENEIGKSINILNREEVEQNPTELLEKAVNNKVVFLVAGDPMIATTHVDLRLRAGEIGAETKIIHAPSIHTAAPGLSGLQSYKFGQTATLPLPDKPAETPYKVLEKNKQLGLHTLFLLDIEAEKERYLTGDKAIKFLLNLEEKYKRNVFPENHLSIVIARAGSSNPLVLADEARHLVDKNFGPPPHALIVPGKLHFMEAEALEKFADAPEEVVEKYVE